MPWSTLQCQTVYTFWVLASHLISAPAITPKSLTCEKYVRHQLVSVFPLGQMCVCVSWGDVHMGVLVCACAPRQPHLSGLTALALSSNPLMVTDWKKRSHDILQKQRDGLRGVIYSVTYYSLWKPYSTVTQLHTRSCTKPLQHEGPYIEIGYKKIARRYFIPLLPFSRSCYSRNVGSRNVDDTITRTCNIPPRHFWRNWTYAEVQNVSRSWF